MYSRIVGPNSKFLDPLKRQPRPEILVIAHYNLSRHYSQASKLLVPLVMVVLMVDSKSVIPKLLFKTNFRFGVAQNVLLTIK